MRSNGGLISVEVTPLRAGSCASMGQLSSANAGDCHNAQAAHKTEHRVTTRPAIFPPALDRNVSILLNQIWLLRQLANPDIAETDGIAVILQVDAATFLRRVLGFLFVSRRAFDVEIVMHDDTVVQ